MDNFDIARWFNNRFQVDVRVSEYNDDILIGNNPEDSIFLVFQKNGEIREAALHKGVVEKLIKQHEESSFPLWDLDFEAILMVASAIRINSLIQKTKPQDLLYASVAEEGQADNISVFKSLVKIATNHHYKFYPSIESRVEVSIFNKLYLRHFQVRTSSIRKFMNMLWINDVFRMPSLSEILDFLTLHNIPTFYPDDKVKIVSGEDVEMQRGKVFRVYGVRRYSGSILCSLEDEETGRLGLTVHDYDLEKIK